MDDILEDIPEEMKFYGLLYDKGQVEYKNRQVISDSRSSKIARVALLVALQISRIMDLCNLRQRKGIFSRSYEGRTSFHEL